MEKQDNIDDIEGLECPICDSTSITRDDLGWLNCNYCGYTPH